MKKIRGMLCVVLTIMLVVTSINNLNIRRVEAAESPLSLTINDAYHDFANVSISTNSMTTQGSTYTVYIMDQGTGSTIGTGQVTFEKATQDVKIDFSKVLSAEEKIVAYLYYNGQQVTSSEKEINKCSVDRYYYDNISAKAYPRAVEGTISAFKEVGGTVTATVGGKTYTGTVDREGKFSISFGETLMEDLEVKLNATCIGGCKCKESTVKITNDKNTISYFYSGNYDVYDSYMCLSKKLQENEIPIVIYEGKEYNYNVKKQKTGYEDCYIFSSIKPKVGSNVQMYIKNTYTGCTGNVETIETEQADIQLGIKNYSYCEKDSLGYYSIISYGIHDLDGAKIYIYDGKTTEVHDVTSSYVSNLKFSNPKASGAQLQVYVIDAYGVKSNVEKINVAEDYNDYTDDSDDEDYGYDDDDDEDSDYYYSAKINKIYYGATTIKGYTYPKTSVKVKIGKKTYKTKSSSSGKFTIKKVKTVKIGTKVKFTFTNKNYKSKSWKKTVKVYSNKSATLLYYVYRNNQTIKGYVKKATKGSYVLIKTGGKTYKVKIKKNSKKYKFKIKVNPVKTGQKINVKLYNKFKQKYEKWSMKVYYSNSVKKGMTKAQLKASTFGKPTRINYYSGLEQWVYEFSSRTWYIYFKNGTVYNWSSYSY